MPSGPASSFEEEEQGSEWGSGSLKPRPPDSWPGAFSPLVLSYPRPPPRSELGSSGLLAPWQGLVLQWAGQPTLEKVFYAALSV